MLRGFTDPTPIDADRSVGSVRDIDYDQRQFHLPVELMASLQAFGRQHQLTMNTLAQGAWAVLLSRYSGTEDVLFGVTSSGRPAELTGVESMIGLFINTL